MSRNITLPVNQVRLTNVAVVRMNRHGKRFEVACYKNKILNYRQRIETDLSEVLQTDRVFTNVSKGQFAATPDLQIAFGTTDQEAVCKIILDSGQIQISEMERCATLENMSREVATMVANKCVHPDTDRPYTVTQIRDAMKEAEFSVQPQSNRTVKQQFLDCVRAIQDSRALDIRRARMELAIVLSRNSQNDDDPDDFDNDAVNADNNLMEDLINQVGAIFDNSTSPTTYIHHSTGKITFLIDPSKYRDVDSICKRYQGRLEIVRQVVTAEGDTEVGAELERRRQISKTTQKHNQSKNDIKLRTVESKPIHHHLYHTSSEASADNIQEPIHTLASSIKQISIKNESTTKIDASNQNQYFDQPLENDSSQQPIMNTRKKNKQAQKKSKKAKRREKEEALERHEKIESERQRRNERSTRLGLDNDDKETTSVTSSSLVPADIPGDTKSCNTCGGAFTPSQYRAHFRSDWHRYNIKLKMKGMEPVDQNEFEHFDADAFFE